MERIECYWSKNKQKNCASLETIDDEVPKFIAAGKYKGIVYWIRWQSFLSSNANLFNSW